MALMLIAPPVVEPVTLAEMKARLSIDHDLADPLLTTLVATARAAVERRSGRPLTSQTYRWTLDRIPEDGLVRLPVSPVQAVPAVRVADAGGTLAAVDGAGLLLDLADEPPRLLFTGARPAPGRAIAGIEIDILAGYGPTAEAVPAPLRQAVAMLAAHWYTSRGVGEEAGPPAEVADILAAWRRPRLVA